MMCVKSNKSKHVREARKTEKTKKKWCGKIWQNSSWKRIYSNVLDVNNICECRQKTALLVTAVSKSRPTLHIWPAKDSNLSREFF